MATEHTDPRVRAARRVAKGLGFVGALLLVAGGAVPLPGPLEHLDPSGAGADPATPARPPTPPRGPRARTMPKMGSA